MAAGEQVPTSAHPSSSSSSANKEDLDAKASRLLKSAQRASEAAKRAYAAGLQTTQVRVRQVSEAVLENAHKAKGSSKDFLSKVAHKVDHYSGKAHQKASAYKGNVSRALQADESERENLGFPLSILVWCSSLCGSKKSKQANMESRDMAPEAVDETEFSNEFLAGAAEQYAADLEAAADQLEADAADAEKKSDATAST